MEQTSAESRSSRRSFSFSSLRIRRRRQSEEDTFSRRRGFWSFSSVPARGRRDTESEDVSPPLSSHRLPLTGEQPRAVIRDVSEGPEEAEARPGALKRVSALFSSFRRGKKERERDPPEAPGPVSRASPQQRFVSGQHFFEYLVLVGLRSNNRTSYEPHISYQFPKREVMARSQREDEEKTLKAITLFCFPEGIDWAPLTEYHSETFSFVLTEIDGSRRNGYCRRLLPSGDGARPPEAYCIISKLNCFGLFSKILDEVEKRRQVSVAMIYPFMQKLREAPFPAPGNTVEVKSFIPEAGTEIIRLTRPLDSWLEHVTFSTLFQCLSDEEVLLVFSAVVLERRVLFIADELSTLSQVLHAVAALLYPFSWQHTFISIVPQILMDVVSAPTPYLLGVKKSHVELILDTTDLLMVDLSENREKTFVESIGDEKNILPLKIQTQILEKLKQRRNCSSLEEVNRVVSEVFLNFFVTAVGHVSSFVRFPATDQRGVSGGRGQFERRGFYKAVESKSLRRFVKRFIQTQMFDLFIQDLEQQQPGTNTGVFFMKIQEFNDRKKRDKGKKH